MGLWQSNLALERIEDRLAKQATAMEDLDREIRGLKLEYIELYDKVRHQMSRMAKRSAVVERENNDVEVIEDDPPGVDPISAKILGRRGFLRQQT